MIRNAILALVIAAGLRPVHNVETSGGSRIEILRYDDERWGCLFVVVTDKDGVESVSNYCNENPLSWKGERR